MVDVNRGVVAVDADFHADLVTFLLEQGSRQQDLWGINLYPGEDEEGFSEFDSIFNIRPMQNNRGRGVYDLVVQDKSVRL